MPRWTPQAFLDLERRQLTLEFAPVAVFFLLVWLKASYFNFPPTQAVEVDWNGWRLVEAVQAGVASFAFLLLVLAPVVFLAPPTRYLVLWCIDAAVTLLVLADVIHFRFYGDVMSVTAAGAAGQISLVLESVAALVRPRDALLLGDLLLGVAFYRRYGAALRETASVSPAHRRVLARRMALVGVVLFLAVPARIVALDRGDTFRYGYFRFFGVRKIGLLNYHLYEAGKQSLAVLGRYSVSGEERERALSFLGTWADSAAAPSSLFGVAEGANVIFVMVESLQAFPLGLAVDGQELTPNLNRFGESSLRYVNFYGQTWEGTTSDGEFTSLQSLHPLPSGSVPVRYAGNHFRGLPRVLGERGYATLSAHAYYGDLWRMREMHPALGFQESRFLESYSVTEKIAGGLPDEEFFTQTMPWIEALPEPFMVYLMTMSTHHPYELPERLKTLRLGELEGTTLGDYLHAVHYFDRAFGSFVASLQKSGLLDRSVVVVYGDHKAELGEPGTLATLLTEHAGFPPRRPGFDPLYWSVENQVPLLVRLPGGRAAGVRTVSAGHLDIAPTVLNLLGVADHAMPALGRDVSGDTHALVVFRNGGFALGDTLCVAPHAMLADMHCSELRTGAVLDAERFAPHFARAEERLAVSDALIRGDLIPRLPTAPAVAGR